MIETYGSKRELICDGCEVGFGKVYDVDEFDVMIADAKADGWRMRRVDNQWEHYCSSCK